MRTFNRQMKGRYFTNRLVIIAILFFIRTTDVQSQVPSLSPYNGVVPAIFNSAGGTYDNALSYYRFEWSFGEMLFIHALAPADSSILVTHGVLQPCTEFIGKSPQTLFFDKGDYKIFPNPTVGKFELDFFVRESGQMSLQLINSIGQLLESRSYYYDGCCRIELFDISRLPDGVYFVIADLVPATSTNPNPVGSTIRHSGFKVIKLSVK